MFFQRYILSLIFVFIVYGNLLNANNLQVSNIQLKDKNTIEQHIYISIDISWENSWRISSESANWDAAWVFIKFRTGSGVWQHASLSTSSSDHLAPGGSTVDAVSDGKGIFIYRSSTGDGNNNWTGVELKWNYGLDGVPDDVTDIEIKVLGIEMVYVPQGSFYVGDGSSFGRLWNVADVNTNPAFISQTPIVLKCEDTQADDVQLENDGIYIDGDQGIDSDGNTTVDNFDFPTGYKAFYCMKYEFTNQQFADFLNTLSRTQQNTRTRWDISENTIIHPFPMNNIDAPQYGNSIRYILNQEDIDGPVHFFCDLNNNEIANDPDDGGNIVCCFMGWGDGAAYSDWAGLRPMTELEFEKACRGTEYPVNDEYAWHTTDIYGNSSTNYIFAIPDTIGTVNSYPVNPGTGVLANAQYGYTTGHDTPIEAPLRCGMFATSSSNRINSGGSYYGIMELSGSLTERIVTIGDSQGRTFRGTHGDGYLTSGTGIEGNATNIDWPGIIEGEESDGVKSKKGSGLKGGDWNDNVPRLKISNREWAAYDPYRPDGTGNAGSGFRSVRTSEN